MEMKLTLTTQIKQGDDSRMHMILNSVKLLEDKYLELFFNIREEVASIATTLGALETRQTKKSHHTRKREGVMPT